MFKYILLLLSISLLGCRKSLGPSEYSQWFKQSEENLNESKTDNFIYEVRYLSPELNSLMEFGADKDSISKYLNEYNNYSNFNLKIFAKEKDKDILKYNISNESEYYERLQYFISYVNTNIVAVSNNNDTLPCSFHHYERTYKITPFANISLSFEGDIKKIKALVIKLPFDNKTAVVKINKVSYPELKL